MVIEKLKNSVIISVQAQKNEPFYEEGALLAMMKSVVKGGAQGLRLAGARDIKNAKEIFPNLPVIGITKPDIIPPNYKDLIYITPTLKDVELLAKAGSDIIAFDATLRDRKVKIKDLIDEIHSHNKLAMADISCLSEGKNAYELGADLVSTTLSGYTNNCHKKIDGPDFELLSELTKLNIPTVLEGRISTPQEVKTAFDLGAYCAVIGTAITRPAEITKNFVMKGKI